MSDMAITSLTALIEILSNDEPDVRRNAVLEDWDESVYKEVILSGDVDLVLVCIQNKTVPLWVLEKLCDHNDDRVRLEVASKRRINEDIQMKLASDSVPEVRARLAYNRSVVPRVLQVLREDINELVRSACESRAT